MNTECDTEAVCGIEADSTDLSTGYMVEVKALLLGGAASASSSGNAEEEFGAAVASWLGVDEGDVSVRLCLRDIREKREWIAAATCCECCRRGAVRGIDKVMPFSRQTCKTSASNAENEAM